MNIFLFGAESFLISEKMAWLKKKFVKENPLGGVESFDFAERNIEKFFESLSLGGGLFSAKKLVIAKNIFSLKGKELALVFEQIARRGAGVDLVLIEDVEKFQPRSKEIKKLLTGFETLELKKLNPVSVENFIVKKVAQISGSEVTFDRKVLSKLAGVFFDDLWNLSTEIEKLVNFKKQGMADENDLREAVKIDRQVKIFDLVDAVGRGDRNSSFGLAVRLIEDGEDEFRLFSMIVYQLRNLIRVSVERKKFGPDKNLLGLKLKMHPFVVAKTLSALSLFPERRLKRAYELAAELDFKMKTGTLKPKDGLMDLIFGI